MCLAVGSAQPMPVMAKTRVTSAAVDDKGVARLHLTQPQIFDEIGGTAQATLGVANNVAVLLSELSLPEEAGDINGQGFVKATRDALSAVGDFVYLPLKQKQLALDVDYHSVEDETRSNGVNSFTVGYPLALEHVSKKTMQALARTSYNVVGNANWSHYTEASGKVDITVRDPEYRRGTSELLAVEVRLTNHETTQLDIALDVTPGGQWARMLAVPEMVRYSVQSVLSAIGISYGDVRVLPAVRRGGSVHGDIGMTLYNVRQKLADDQALLLRYSNFGGIPRAAVAAAYSTMYEVTPHDVDVKVHRRKDHYEINVEGSFGKVDKFIEGYLRLREVFDAALVKSRTHNQGLSDLVRNMSAVRTKRFRDVVVAAASSDDSGHCDFKFKVGFPHQRMALTANFKYENTLKAYTFAYRMMKLPITHQSYSRVQVHTTAHGLGGHFLYEVQGPWLESEWALCSAAARGDAELHPIFVADAPPVIDDGDVLVELKKSHLSTHGAIKFDNLASFLAAVLPKDNTAKPQGVEASYDADKAPGVIGVDVFVTNPNRAAAEKLVAAWGGSGLKPKSEASVVPPQPTPPTVQMPAALASEIEADRKFLGVTPWHESTAAAVGDAARRSWMSILTGLLLAVLAGGALWFGQRRKAEQLMVEPVRTRVVSPPPQRIEAPVASAAPRASSGLAPAPSASPLDEGAGAAEEPPAPVVDEAADFKRDLEQRLRAAYPNYSIREKDHFEMYVVKDGIPHVLDLEPLYFLTKRPGIDRDRAIESFVKTLPNLR
jgi:hypothetical protein